MAKMISLDALQTATHFPVRETRLYFGLPLRAALVYAILFAIAFCTYNILWKTAPLIVSDSGTYMTAAQDLSDFRIDHLQKCAPGYPLLLLLTGSSQSPNRTLFLVSLLLHFLSIWLLAALLYRVGLTELILTLFAFILLLPPYVEPAAYVLSENLTEAMLVAGLVSFFFWTREKRTIWILVSTLAFGYAALTRPTFQILSLSIIGYLFIATFLFQSTLARWKEFLKASFALICGAVFIIGGYAYVNYRSVGYFGLSPKLGLTLSQKTLRTIEKLPDEYAPVREALITARNLELINGVSHTGYEYIWNTVSELSDITGFQYLQLSDYMLRLNLLLIRKAPLAYLQDFVWAFGLFWFPSADKLANMDSRVIQFLWAVLHFCTIGAWFVSLILIVGALTFIKFCSPFVQQTSKPTTTLLEKINSEALIYGLAATIVFYTAIISCLIEIGSPRYRVPTDVLILFMLFLGIRVWRQLSELCQSILSTDRRDIA